MSIHFSSKFPRNDSYSAKCSFVTNKQKLSFLTIRCATKILRFRERIVKFLRNIRDVETCCNTLTANDGTIQFFSDDQTYETWNISYWFGLRAAYSYRINSPCSLVGAWSERSTSVFFFYRFWIAASVLIKQTNCSRDSVNRIRHKKIWKGRASRWEGGGGGERGRNLGSSKDMENNDEARTVADRASTSKEEPLEATADDDYGCEHYKRKSKFVVSISIGFFLQVYV